MRKKIIAAIDVGSHAIRMKIGEINKAGEFRCLEKFRKIAVLGHDTFTKEKLTFDSVDKICEILKDFKITMEEYQVEVYKMMGTSAIREASNRDYIVDQIRLKTGMDIDVIDNSEEQFLTLKAIKYKLDNYQALIQEGAVIVVIGAGSIQITTYHHGELKSSQNVKMGALRVKEILGALENNTLKYYKMLNEYIEVNLEGLDFFDKKNVYKNLIAIGGEISVISRLIYDEVIDETQYIKKKKFEELYKELLEKSTDDIKRSYDIRRERAEIIVPSMMLFQRFIEKTSSKEIIAPNISLTDGIIRLIHEELYNLYTDDITMEDIITNAVVLAKQYDYNKEHCEWVERNALLLFDKLKKIHGLKEERILLRVSTILHDIGKFISLDMHSIHSYNLIRSLELFGMSSMDMELIANISRYHSMSVPKEQDENFTKLSTKNRLIVAKLISIIRIADALDRSHKQKINLKTVKVKNKQLIIMGSSRSDTTLEEWNFKRKAEFFQEVFGISPILKITREL